ncbi:MAG: hypothetical protein E7019_02655 [Alphaproteobacteria bacterium]|nr:hypothetical protein [Alphaproteobacteria bacterium]
MKRLDKDVAPADNDPDWLEIIKSVKKIPQSEEKPTAPLIINEPEDNIHYSEVYNGDTLRRLEVGCVDNIDRRTAEKFKKGNFKIEARLDLHGKTEKQAFEAVEDFVKKSYLKKLRCILIITGKGFNKEDDLWYEKKGILKEAVPSWLNRTELRPLILSFSYANQEDGGSGALYVLLRRKRA